MEKIISLFKRDYEGTRLVYDEVVPGAEWVLAGEGAATRKYDGTCCLIENGQLFKRYEVKKGKTPPPEFYPATEVDPVTGKQQGWVPVGDGPEDQYHREAYGGTYRTDFLPDGTYELCGPKVQGGPEGFTEHILIQHGIYQYPEEPKEFCDPPPRTFDGIRAFLSKHDIEGIVWHHPDGRMVKIKKKDFGLKR